MCGLGQCVLKSAEELKTSPCGQGPCGICSHSRRSAATRKLYIAWFQRSGGNVGFRLFTNTTHSRGINDGECYDAAIEPGGRQIYTLCSTSNLHPDSPKDGAPRIYLIDNGHI